MAGLALGTAVTARFAHATLITFTASLDGSQQVPAVSTTGIGSGTVVLDDVADTITVDRSRQNLSAPAAAAHIHGPGAVG